MIFLTLGTQLPFDRLLAAMDEIAPSLDEPVFAQTGETQHRVYNFETVPSMSPAQFDEKFSSSRLVVSHAGIGTVLTAQSHGKPIILFPRRAAMGEHRNDHQLATCNQLEQKAGIYIARDVSALNVLVRRKDLKAADAASEITGRQSFINNLRARLQIIAGQS